MKRSQRHWLFLGFAAGAAAGLAAWLIRRGQAARLVLANQVNELTRHAVEGVGVPVESRFVPVNEVQLHTVVAGPRDGPLALLLHGFPECWYSWRHQIAPLVGAGYRVIVPDQRGYNLSDKPPDVPSYQIDQLTADVRELIRAFDSERAVLVAHDWGGAVAWRFAMDYADMVDKLIVMNAPHPVAFARELRASWSQRLKSWYMLFFQLPWLPETLLSLSPLASARLFFRQTAVRAGAFSAADLTMMAAALAQPGALRTMVHWYRAAFRYSPARRNQVIKVPTLLVWAEDDVALAKSLTYGLEKWIPYLTTHYIPHCGHWVQNEAPDEVNDLVQGFIAREQVKRLE